MKRLLWTGLIALAACGGSLSDEQRKKMREEMELHEIKRVTEVEITEAAYAQGRAVMAALEKTSQNNASIDSLAQATKTSIKWVKVGSTNALEIEQQLIDAYITGAADGTLQDNVQKIRHGEEESDSLLYTKPVVSELPDGSVQVEGTWSIILSKKELILSMGKE